jgi:thiol-disulfide isomerase/thioredoxin
MEDRMYRRSILPGLLASGALTASLPPSGRSAAQSSRRVPTPEFAGIDGWLNTADPLSIAGLRGKVVLVDFWTYSCINCRRTVPYLNRWQAEYGLQGLQGHCRVGGLCPGRSGRAKLAGCSPTSPAILATAFRPRSSAMPYGFITCLA